MCRADSRRRRRARPERHSRQERRRAGRQGRAAVRRRPRLVRRPAAGDGGGDDARCRAPRRRARDHRDRCGARRSSTSRRRWPPRPMSRRRQTLLRGDPDAALKTAPHTLSCRVQRRRAGAFLSRRPDRLRPAGRGRRHRRALLDPASDRGPAHLRPPAGLRLQPRDRGGAPAGRRLRRQGEQRLVGRGRGGAGGQPHRQAGEAPPAARDRHDRDRQAPSASSIATRWASTTRAACWRSTRCWRPMPAGASTSRRAWWRARSPTPTTPTGSRISAPSATPARRTSSRTPRSAASAGRRASSSWRMRSTASRTISAAIRSRCARSISTATAGDETPYGQKVEENHLPRIWAEVKRDADYARRRAEIDAFNKTSPVLKRGLGLFPLKFGISFNIPHMNQAGALVHVYTDGSIRLNHGGTEMGQGLFIKVAQVVAEVFKVDIDRIRPTRDLDRRGAQHLADRGLDRLRPQRLGGLRGGQHHQAAHDRLRRRAFRRRPRARSSSPTTPCASPSRAATRW